MKGNVGQSHNGAAGEEQAQGTSDESQQQRFDQDQRHNQSAGKAERLEHTNFLLPFADGDAHGVGRHQQDGEGHRQADAVQQQRQSFPPWR